LEYNRETVDSFILPEPPVRRLAASNVQDTVSVQTIGTKKHLVISGDIRSFNVATYQFAFTCIDEYNDSIISFPFRIVVKDSDLNPEAEP